MLSALLLAPSAVLAGWGWSDDGKNFVIDTNANLVVKVSKFNGDMTSVRYRGVEYSGQNGKYSHVESGLGASTVTIKTYNSINYNKCETFYTKYRRSDKCSVRCWYDELLNVVSSSCNSDEKKVF